MVTFIEDFRGPHQDILIPWVPRTTANSRWTTLRESQHTTHFYAPQYYPKDGFGNRAGDDFLFDHGVACEPPPATHTMTSWADAYFLCDPHDATNHPPPGTIINRHMMTSIADRQYGVLYFSPNHLLDWTDGEATLSFDLSSFVSTTRDWVDFWLQPFATHLAQPLENWLPDLWGFPEQAINIRFSHKSPEAWDMTHHTAWKVARVENFIETVLPGNDTVWFQDFLAESKTRRDRLQLTISSTHVKWGYMPGQPAVNAGMGFFWVDHEFATPLNYTKAVVTFGHHTYNPNKDQQPFNDGSSVTPRSTPNTWHWSNFTMSSAQPYTLRCSLPEWVIGSSTQGTWQTVGPFVFDLPAPANAYVRFQAQSDWRSEEQAIRETHLPSTIGSRPGLQISWDGTTWITPNWQESHFDPLNLDPTRAKQWVQAPDPREGEAANDYFLNMNWWHPVPEGTAQMYVRSYGGWGGPLWRVGEAVIMSPDDPGEPIPGPAEFTYSSDQTTTTAADPDPEFLYSGDQTATTSPGGLAVPHVGSSPYIRT